MFKTQRTFYEVRSWKHNVVGKRIPKLHMALERARELDQLFPGAGFYVTQSLGRFKDGAYTPW